MNIKRTFFIGEEWLYYKIYCGNKTADNILSNIIKPISATLIKNKYIDKWFFIRYSDPKSHLRVRFHFSNKDNIFFVINLLHTKLNDLVESGVIWKVMTDTYTREIERYGTKTMECAESIFYNDSVLVVNILSFLKCTNSNESDRWQVALISINELLNDFKLTLSEKYLLTKYLKESFSLEFKSDTNLKKQLKSKYRKECENIFSALGNKLLFPKCRKLILDRTKSNYNCIPILNKYIKSNSIRNNYLFNFIHMHNNRLFSNQQRLHELVLYDFLYNYYRSELAKTGIKLKDINNY
ncbi:MAG: thiopeptide-type bacteriocin biosynthesis protein [Bacteroidales bacterium]|nr:thiopeptide-type bacteriocin biosynthesis protein [Bacteroidales bacterium]